MKRLAVLILSVSIMTSTMVGCSKDEFMDISRFTDNFNSLCETEIISLSSYIIQNETYSLPFSDGDETVLLSGISHENGSVEEIRITVSKTDEKGKSSPVNEKRKALFVSVIKKAVESYTYFDSDETERILEDMKLNDIGSYNLTGELTAQKGNFYFVYYSTELVSMFRIFNIHLHPIEKTEKPESKPAFGNTTNIRTETVPLK